MRKRPESHEVDQEGQALFRYHVPKDWALAEPSPDPGVDYLVQVFENQAATDVTFEVQLKSSGEDASDTIRRQLKTSDLVDWITNRPSPVVVVAADTAGKRLRWRLASDITSELSKTDPDWRSKRRKTVHFSSEAALPDSAETLERVVRQWAEDRRRARTTGTGLLFSLDDYVYSFFGYEPVSPPFRITARVSLLSDAAGRLLTLAKVQIPAGPRSGGIPYSLPDHKPVVRLSLLRKDGHSIGLDALPSSSARVSVGEPPDTIDIELVVSSDGSGSLLVDEQRAEVNLQDPRWNLLIVGAEPQTGADGSRSVLPTPGWIAHHVTCTAGTTPHDVPIGRFEFPALDPRLDLSGKTHHLQYPMNRWSGAVSSTNDPILVHDTGAIDLKSGADSIGDDAWRKRPSSSEK